MPSTKLYSTEPTYASPCIQYIQFQVLNILQFHGVRKNVTSAEKMDMLKFFDLHFCFVKCVDIM